MAVLTAALAIMMMQPAEAYQSYLDRFYVTYPGSSSADNAGCQLCHGSSDNSTFNEYGWRFSENDEIFTSVESLPSMNLSGGTTMLDEINAGSQPGWTSGSNNYLYDKNGLIRTDALPPATISGALDPAVANIPPTADPNGPYTGTTGIAVTFDGSASSDADGSITTYNWNFGDGSTGTGVSPAHTYTSPGTYTVSLTVTDNDGDTSNPATTTASISLPIQPHGAMPWLPLLLE